MRDVVVIGGGLSGLAACYELEKHKIRYTVIEVKARFGGGIASSAEKGFVADGSAFASRRLTDGALLEELGLAAQLFDFGAGSVGFRGGTESLIHALARGLTGGRLMRMAVSSLGRWRGRFTICMENGLMFDAGALIVAAPARFAARIFDSLSPEIAEGLRGYQYDRIYRVSLGYHKRDLPARLEMPPDMAFPFLLATDQPGRVPDEFHRLVQVGVRAAADADPHDIVQAAVRQCGWGEKPMMQRVHYWAEADPLSCYDEGHRANMAAIQNLLPAGVGLIGSDYSQPAPQHKGIARLDDRIRQGRLAARAAIAYRKASKRAHV